MASVLTITGDDVLLNYMFSTASVTRPTTWYAGLIKAYNKATNTVTEVNGSDDSNYARVACGMTVSINPGSDGISTAKNTSDAVFPVPATGASYSVTHVGIYDASTSGRLLAVVALGYTRTVDPATPVVIRSNNLIVASPTP